MRRPLIAATQQNDYAALVITADDTKNVRGKKRFTPRDNVIFELGLFMGVLGRHRTFVIYDRDQNPKLPSDLDGLGTATYSLDGHATARAALGAACTEIEDMMRRDILRRKV